MFVLLMMRFYLDEILDGSKSSDARLYPTDIRGRIALGDSSTNKVYALADLVSCTPISYGEFVEWHRTGPFAYTEFAPYHAGRACYSYGLENVRKIPVPVKVPNPGGARVWLEVSEDVSKKFTAQRTLFRRPGTCGPSFAETFRPDFNRVFRGVLQMLIVVVLFAVDGMHFDGSPSGFRR